MGARHLLRTKGGLPPEGARLAALLARFLLAAAILVGGTAMAAAHASLLRATPAEGTVVQTLPPQATLTFSEPVTPLVIELLRPDGGSVRLIGDVSDDGLSIALPANDAASGTYLLSWRVVSTDGHPVAGYSTFSVGSPSATPPVTPELNDPTLRAALWAAKLALYLGVFFGAGGAFALAWLAPKSRHGMATVTAFTALGLVAAPVSFGLQGLDALGAPLGLLGQPVTWQAAAATSYGFTAAIAFMALALALLALASEGALARGLALAALVGTGAALAASGHASAAAPQWLTRPMVFVHGAGIAFWAGALVPLGLACRHRAPDAGEALRRFSTAIPYVVAALIAAGVVLAVIQVEKVQALWQTAYGRLLLIKLALVVPLLLLAAVNRWKLTKPSLVAQPDAQRRLARNIVLETLVMVAILAAVAGFRFTPPPRVLAIEAAEPATFHVHTPEAMADVSLTPGRAGAVSASIVIMSGDFGPLDARSVTLRMNHAEAKVAPISVSAHKPGDGTWRIDGMELPVPGTWTAAIDVEISATERVTLTSEITIRP
ncbi:copper transport protein [Aminobacter niigataensis]|uniref:Copper transport protein n=1 Tax=Aminobacter niigataensis TaxID=83265 RepID=A0ABR6L4W8_9HYPH|nr:CopD family protein [Aminobacter niigataensis]MBB4651658.1 copper transport protein [Aminobacter niigataensis]